jgi:hypothetical protein
MGESKRIRDYPKLLITIRPSIHAKLRRMAAREKRPMWKLSEMRFCNMESSLRKCVATSSWILSCRRRHRRLSLQRPRSVRQSEYAATVRQSEYAALRPRNMAIQMPFWNLAGSILGFNAIEDCSLYSGSFWVTQRGQRSI